MENDKPLKEILLQLMSCSSFLQENGSQYKLQAYLCKFRPADAINMTNYYKKKRTLRRPRCKKPNYMLQIQGTMVRSHRPAWNRSRIRQAGGALEAENGSGKIPKGGKKTGRKGKRLRTSKRRKENNLD